MVAQPATAPMSRIVYVAQNTAIWIQVMENELTVEELDAFANGAEQTAHEKSREMQKLIKDDANWLTSHAACMRTTSAKIVLLRDGLVPALKIDKDNPRLRLEAVAAMGYIRADFEAMECGFR